MNRDESPQKEDVEYKERGRRIELFGRQIVKCRADKEKSGKKQRRKGPRVVLQKPRK